MNAKLNDSDAAHQVEELKDKAKDKIDDLDQQTRDTRETIHRQGSMALNKAEEMPDSTYLAAVGGSMVVSALLVLMHKRELGIFIGLWAPTILSMARFMKERRPSRDL